MYVWRVGRALFLRLIPRESHALLMSRSVVAPIVITISEGDFVAKISFDGATSSKSD